MNTLSWMIYLAEVSERLGATAKVVVAATLFVATFWLLFRAMSLDQDGPLPFSVPPVPWRGLIATAGLALALAVVAPSQRTVLLVAASEAAARVAATPEAQALLGQLTREIGDRLGEGR